MKQTSIIASILLALTAPCSFAADADTYAFNVQVLPPFGRVKINNSITCPSSSSAICLVSNQKVGSTMTITGTKEHACYITINEDGSATVDTVKSYFCWPEITPANATTPGKIVLPKHF